MAAVDTAGPHWEGDDPLPGDPLPILAAWLDEAFAAGLQPNPHAVALATLEPGGAPAVRMVLCQAIDAERGRSQLLHAPRQPEGARPRRASRAALCFFFGPQNRQVRVGGPVLPAPDADSDAYFASRPEDARIGAWASQQSGPIGSRAELVHRVREVARRFGAAVPRPPRWGGYVVIAASVELWISGLARLHDRGRWPREVSDPRPARPLAHRAAPALSAEGLQP